MRRSSYEQSLPGVDGRLESNTVPGPVRVGLGGDDEARGLGGAIQ